MHTNRPLFNLPGEGVSLYQSPVIVKFIIPDIALVSHDTTRVADPSVSASLLNPTRAASTYSYSPDRSRGPIPTLALPHLRAGMPRSGFSPAALEFTAGPHQGTKAEGDQRFESISLQRGVQCEPGVSATGSKCGDNSSLEGPRVRIRLPPARSLFTEKAPYPAAELDRLCLDHIARFKRPRDYRFVEALPKNNYGKVLKTELRRLLTDNPEEGRPTR
jgi:hypothetical protein